MGDNTKNPWALPNQNIHQPTTSFKNTVSPPMYNSASRQAPLKNNFDFMVQEQLQMLSSQKTSNQTSLLNYSNESTSNLNYGSKNSRPSNLKKKYDPFLDNPEDMDISDDEKPSQNNKEGNYRAKIEETCHKPLLDESMELQSGAAFYKGLILYIPPFERIPNSYCGSPAMKMLHASFEFSFKKSVKIETKPKENSQNLMEATVLFKDNVIAIGSGPSPHVEASVRALEILAETCYTIQAKENQFLKSKLVNADTLRTLNLKKWEAVCVKYPKLLEITKDGHIQKTFALLLDNHTSSGVFEDIVCCNLTRQDVTHIKSVVEFFHLTMLPCCISTNLSKENTPCVVSIHKYTSARKLLNILTESGGENDQFKLFPPDTFKDFFKLHPNFWDSSLKKEDFFKDGNQTTLNSKKMQALILNPYKNTISELFEKHKVLPKKFETKSDNLKRKAGDDFMKEKLQIDMSCSKSLAPVERMQLLLKYMEQLQEYGSRVLTSGKTEMIKIYHNAIDNLRKDLDTCRQDIEKEQKNHTVVVIKQSEKTESFGSKSSSPKRKTPPRKRSMSPVRSSRLRSPKRQATRTSSLKRPRRSPSPKKHRRTPSPKKHRRTPSPRRRPRSKSPRRRPLPRPSSPRRRPSSPPPPKRAPSPRPYTSQLFSSSNSVLISIFRDQFRRYVDNLRRFRIEIEDTPIERRASLKESLLKYRSQLNKFHTEAKQNPRDLGEFIVEMDICRDELQEQTDMINGKPGPNDLPRSITPPPWISSQSRQFEPSQLPVSYPLPNTRDIYGARLPPPPPPIYQPTLQNQHPDMRYSF